MDGEDTVWRPKTAVSFWLLTHLPHNLSFYALSMPQDAFAKELGAPILVSASGRLKVKQLRL